MPPVPWHQHPQSGSDDHEIVRRKYRVGPSDSAVNGSFGTLNSGAYSAARKIDILIAMSQCFPRALTVC